MSYFDCLSGTLHDKSVVGLWLGQNRGGREKGPSEAGQWKRGKPERHGRHRPSVAG